MNQPLMIEEYAAMLMAFGKTRPQFTLEFDSSTLVLLLGTLKFALTQEGYPEYSKRQMLKMADELLKCFNSDPALAALMRTEWAAIAQSVNGTAPGNVREIQPLNKKAG